MREILFRAKTTDENEWIYGDIFHSGADPEQLRIHDYKNRVNYAVNPETLGQYTGLTDKNGVKIFEGDIVKTYDPDDSPAAVVYDETETQYGIVIDNIYYCLGEHFRGIDLEVLGNIYDNPELIKDGDADEEP